MQPSMHFLTTLQLFKVALSNFSPSFTEIHTDLLIGNPLPDSQQIRGERDHHVRQEAAKAAATHTIKFARLLPAA